VWTIGLIIEKKLRFQIVDATLAELFARGVRELHRLPNFSSVGRDNTRVFELTQN